MAQTFTYDLISFLRVLYLRRRFILKGTVIVTLAAAAASLLWPETWRANARIFVSTPKYKKALQLVPEPFDVLTYQGIMNDNGLLLEIIDTLKWFRDSTHELLEPPKVERLKKNLAEKATGLTRFEWIENTNLKLLSELLPQGRESEEQWKFKIGMLGLLSSEELEIVYKLTPYQLDKMTVFQLRKSLKTQVEKVKETNLETIYSRLIQVSADFNTAVGAKVLANLWLDLFMTRAERMARSEVQSQIRFTEERAAAVEITLASAEAQLTLYKNSTQLDIQRAETASKRILLTGVEEFRELETRKNENFNLDNANEPFLKERREFADLSSFKMTPLYEQALIPHEARLQDEIGFLSRSLERESDTQGDKIRSDLEKAKAQLAGITAQIQAVSQEIMGDSRLIRDQETRMAALERKVQQLKSALDNLQPFLNEAQFLESRKETARYADVSADRAIKPDKRLFPVRSIMTLLGGAIAFLLFCGLAFLLDIWNEVTRPEETQESQPTTIS